MSRDGFGGGGGERGRFEEFEVVGATVEDDSTALKTTAAASSKEISGQSLVIQGREVHHTVNTNRVSGLFDYCCHCCSIAVCMRAAVTADGGDGNE